MGMSAAAEPVSVRQTNCARLSESDRILPGLAACPAASTAIKNIAKSVPMIVTARTLLMEA